MAAVARVEREQLRQGSISDKNARDIKREVAAISAKLNQVFPSPNNLAVPGVTRSGSSRSSSRPSRRSRSGSREGELSDHLERLSSAVSDTTFRSEEAKTHSSSATTPESLTHWERLHDNDIDAEKERAIRQVSVVLQNIRAGKTPKRLVARDLDKLSMLLHDVGMNQDAERMSMKAVFLYEELVKDSFDDYAVSLANALHNGAVHMSSNRHYQSAHQNAERSVSLLRQLVKKGKTDYRPDLAHSLNVLSNAKARLKQHEGARIAAEDALSIWQILYHDHGTTFSGDFALALIAKANHLCRSGQHAASIRHASDAATLLRPLYDRDSSKGKALAEALSIRARCLMDLDRHEDALAPAEEARQLRQGEVERRRTESNEHHLASACFESSEIFSAVNKHDQALRLASQSVQLYTTLSQPNYSVYRRHLNEALHRRADCNIAMGYYKSAKDTLVQLLDDLEASDDPPETRDSARLEILISLYNCHKQLKNWTGASDVAAQAVELTKGLQGKDSDLAKRLEELLGAQKEAKLSSKALKTSKDLILVYRRLLNVDPDNYRVRLANALYRMSLSNGEYDPSALKPAQEAVSLYTEHLSASSKSRTTGTRNLAIGQLHLGDCYFSAKKFAEAGAAADEALRLYQALRATDPNNGDYKKGVKNAKELLDECHDNLQKTKKGANTYVT